MKEKFSRIVWGKDRIVSDRKYSIVPCGTREILDAGFQGLRPWLISDVAPRRRSSRFEPLCDVVSRQWGIRSEPPYVGCYERKRWRASGWLLRRGWVRWLGISCIAATGPAARDTVALRAASQSMMNEDAEPVSETLTGATGTVALPPKIQTEYSFPLFHLMKPLVIKKRRVGEDSPLREGDLELF